MSMRLLLLPLLLALPVLAVGPKIAIVTGAQAPPLEKLAASELSALFVDLFEAETSIGSQAPSAGVPTVLVGSPETNPAITQPWPKVSRQGQVIKSVGGGVLVVGGGSPLATLWAVYELGHRFGVRHLLHGDALPVEKPAFRVDGFDVVMEPLVATRAWNGYNGTITGTESWSGEDQVRLLKQLAKLKFTHYVVTGDHNTLLPLIRVDGDTAGRKAFRGEKTFEALAPPADVIQNEAASLGITVVKGLPDKVLPLGAPVNSVLPQFSLRQLAGDWKALRDSKAGGFLASAVVPGDLNASVHFVSRAAFDDKTTAESALNDLVTPICGEGVYERLQKGFDLIEQAAKLIAANEPGVAVPAPGFMLRHDGSKEPPPAWWTEAKTAYTNAMNEMYRANTRARGGARPFILYHAKRLEFAMQFFNALEGIRKAGNAKADNQADAREEALGLAVESIYNALNAYADVARDPSDRGVIAVLNKEGYHRLLELSK